jgi:hypothetical protein
VRTLEMLETHPGGLSGVDKEKLAECIAACFECAQACAACADACLAEDMVADLVECIRTDMSCADVCLTTGRALSRRAGRDREIEKALLVLCALACRTCGDECARHAEMHEHCRICAEACRRCEKACHALLAG